MRANRTLSDDVAPSDWRHPQMPFLRLRDLRSDIDATQEAAIAAAKRIIAEVDIERANKKNA